MIKRHNYTILGKIHPLTAKVHFILRWFYAYIKIYQIKILKSYIHTLSCEMTLKKQSKLLCAF